MNVDSQTRTGLAFDRGSNEEPIRNGIYPKWGLNCTTKNKKKAAHESDCLLRVQIACELMET